MGLIKGCWQRYHAAIRTSLVAFALLGLTPTVTWAQSAIAGVVRDTSGAVLPGVTVEASSPALIEKVRTAVTDGTGLYQIVDLRPGNYTVTFTLPGFSVVKRDGIELPSGFTATVNGELRVGGIEETLTVTGEAPMVDVRQSAKSTTFTQEALTQLPVLYRTVNGFVATIPGVSNISLGTIGNSTRALTIRGSNSLDNTDNIDGFSMGFSSGGGSQTNYTPNQAAFQEYTIKIGGGQAEERYSAIVSNAIPKAGGNAFSGYFFAAGQPKALVGDNVSDALKATGFTTAGLEYTYDYAPAFGGAIVRDKFWYYLSFRYAGYKNKQAGNYVNMNPYGWVVQPDPTKPATNYTWDMNTGVNLTYQVTPRNKLSFFLDNNEHTNYNFGYSSTTAQEATSWNPVQPMVVGNTKWTSPISNRLLAEGGLGFYISNYNPRRDFTMQPRGGRLFPQDFTTVRKSESTTGVNFGSPSNYGINYFKQMSYRASVSYVTGTHALKIGTQNTWTRAIASGDINQAYTVSLTNGRPTSLTQFVQPNTRVSGAHADMGIYAQDDWTMNRLTLNLGVRFDYFNGYNEAGSLAAGRFVPAREYPGTDGIPLWKDVSPRLGGSYDLFGNGKTALKFTYGGYVRSQPGVNSFAALNNPVVLSVLSASRSWTDSNNNFLPDCDLTNLAAQNLTAAGGDNCGALNNQNFGKANPAATQYSSKLSSGWRVRPYVWDLSAQIDHQLTDQISMSLGYFRHWYTHLSVTDNTRVTATDYDTYCITAPTDSRLPGGGGYRVCGLADIKPALFGQSQTFIGPADDYGKVTDVYNGVDLTTQMRFQGGGRVSGGVSFGRQRKTACFGLDSPQVAGIGNAGVVPSTQYCDVKPSFDPKVTLSGSYLLPYGITTGVVFFNQPGPPITATYQINNTIVAPALGRNLSAGANGTTNVELIEPGTFYGDRWTQLEFKVGKLFRFGRQTYEGAAAIQNVFNAGTPLSMNSTFGPNFMRPTSIQPARSVKLSLEVNF